MKLITLTIFSVFLFLKIDAQKSDAIIADGRMPNIAKDKSNIHIVYGSGDSIMYVSSKTGKAFTSPALVAVLPGVFASAMRGPQIAATGTGLIVTACTKSGNMFSYRKEGAGKWSKSIKVNDANETAKEALMALSADGTNAFAVWLSVAGKGQNVIGAKSTDGGKTWKKNTLVYASPDNTVCECCKPTVVVKGSNVYVMFRNQLYGNRDLHLIQSSNGGTSFSKVQKLGVGSWKLTGCPMDGGGLAVNKNGTVQTVWRREGKIFAATPGKPEKEIGDGRGCTIETANGKNIYAWTENGEVVLLNSQGKKKTLGKGSQPVLKALNNEQVICVWENEKQIHASVIEM